MHRATDRVLNCVVQDPIDNLVDHISSPWTANFTTNNISLPFQSVVTAPYS